MKAVFGILSLVVVLAVLGFVARKQQQAVDAGGGIVQRGQDAESRARALAADSANRAAQAGAGTVPQQARSIQERARDNTVRALEQGADGNRRAEP